MRIMVKITKNKALLSLVVLFPTFLASSGFWSNALFVRYGLATAT